ncbi:MAG: transposase [Acholeplasmataceae bacterium]
MGRPKGAISKRPNRYWSKEDKYDYVKIIMSGETSITQLARDNGISRGMLSTWLKKYQTGGIDALENQRKPGNPLSKFQNKKTLTPLEALQYENMKLKIENERLKKGYTTEEVMAIRQRRSSKKNTKS